MGVELTHVFMFSNKLYDVYIERVARLFRQIINGCWRCCFNCFKSLTVPLCSVPVFVPVQPVLTENFSVVLKK